MFNTDSDVNRIMLLLSARASREIVNAIDANTKTLKSEVGDVKGVLKDLKGEIGSVKKALKRIEGKADGKTDA